LTKFLKIDMLHVVLDCHKISKTILEKLFLFYFLPFLSFFGFCVAKFEQPFSEVNFFFLQIGLIGYKKNREFYHDFKKSNLH
jgi:hypothetical protein